MIVVAGGSGRLGSQVARTLLDSGEDVRVLTRDAARATGLAAAGASVAVGDVRRPDTLSGALRDARVVVSAVHGFAGPGRVSPASVDRDGNVNLIRAAERQGAEVVLLSVVGADPAHPLELFRMKAAAEDAVRRSTVPWTIVRATAFLELYQELLGGRGRRPLVFGRGENPLNFVPVADVAATVVQACVDSGLRGRVVEVAGRENLTLNQLAARVAPDLSPRHVPRAVLRLLASGAPQPVRRMTATALVMDTAPMTAYP